MARFEPRPTNPFPLPELPRPASFPLSTGQERLWWLRQRQPESAQHQYHVHGGWLLDARPDPEALTAALSGLVRRHEILRTRFVLRPDGTTAQEIIDDVVVPTTWAGKEWRTTIDRVLDEPFDLSRPPLFRVVVAELDEGHGLFLALHHIITDRWSMDILARDLFELYTATRDNRAPQLPELPVQYGDYALWQRRFLTGEHVGSQLDYWQQALAGYQRLELPTDRPRQAADDPAAGAVTVDIPAETTEAMTALAWRTRASTAIVVTAALAASLRAFTGQTDIVIGAIISDRPRPELQDVIGFFINTVVLRIDLSGTSLTFRETIKRTRDAWLTADAHQDTPFEQIAARLGTGAEDGRHPIFDVAVNHAGGWQGIAAQRHVPPAWEPDVPATARFDLSLITQPVGERLRATFAYRTSLFDPPPVIALANHYTRLLEQGTAAPEAPLASLRLTDDAERALPHRHNDLTPAPATTIVARIQEQVTRRPDAPAVTGAGGTLTYRQLNERANQLARHLRTLGAGPERIVAVCLDRTVDTAVVLLAISKAGAAYLPLDPEHPADRLRFVLSDTGAILTVVSPALRERIPAGTPPTLVVGAGEPDLTGYSRDDPPLAATADNLAYLISTSGSTGTPKAVAVPHRALSRLVEGAPRWLDVGPGTTFLQAGPLTFDVAVLEWTPLAHGGCVAVADTGTLLDNLGTVVRDLRVTTLKLVSPQLDLMVERDLQALTPLRRLVVGGDVVNPKSFAAARDALPHCQVLASYGPTESTVVATVFDAPEWTGRVPIGHAIPHTTAYVLDQDLNPAQVGMRGEIHLAGDGLARGYHGRPGLTAASFVPNPHGRPGSRMYRTGDLGRYLPDGTIDFLGRADHQVKIRGYRIETGEIENILLRQPSVKAAVVVAASLPTGPALAAYVVPAGPLDQAALRHTLHAALPAYMVPNHIIELSHLPLTANNKVDRTALPPVTTAPVVTEEPVLATGLPTRIADVWSTVLGHQLAPSDDFFAHGGHSLLVPRATAAVRQLLGWEAPLRLMTRHRTPRAYAEALLRESIPDLGPAHLEEHPWLAEDRPVRLFTSADGGQPAAKAFVVLDGTEFTDIIRLPAILDRLVREEKLPGVCAVFVDPTSWPARRRELLDQSLVDTLADNLVPHVRSWLGDPNARVTAVGASLGGITALRAALRRPDTFDSAIVLSAPLTDHQLTHPDAPPSPPTRAFLYASHEEEHIILDDANSLVTATALTGKKLTEEGHTVRCAYGEGGHTYAAWQAILPEALTWITTS